MNPIEDLFARISEFANERDWDQFHTPKNLAMALSGEVGELVQEFQWLTEEQSKNLGPTKLPKVKDEIGDVMIYLLRLCQKLNIDPVQAASDKMAKNAIKYPVNKSKGSALKYTEL